MIYFADKSEALKYFLEHEETCVTYGCDSFGWFVTEKEQ